MCVQVFCFDFLAQSLFRCVVCYQNNNVLLVFVTTHSFGSHGNKLFIFDTKNWKLFCYYFLYSYASSDDGSFMTADDLLDFVHTEQDNEEATIEYCQTAIERFEPSEAGKRHLLSVDGR